MNNKVFWLILDKAIIIFCLSSLKAETCAIHNKNSYLRTYLTEVIRYFFLRQGQLLAWIITQFPCSLPTNRYSCPFLVNIFILNSSFSCGVPKLKETLKPITPIMKIKTSHAADLKKLKTFSFIHYSTFTPKGVPSAKVNKSIIPDKDHAAFPFNDIPQVSSSAAVIKA